MNCTKLISIIIPVKNEADNIAEVLRGVHQYAPEAIVVVVNDNSGDNTLSILHSIPGIVVLNSTIDLGIGSAVQLGIKGALALGAEQFLRMDGDGQHPAKYIPDLLKNLESADFVQAYRKISEFRESSTFVRSLASRYLQFLFSPVPWNFLPYQV